MHERRLSQDLSTRQVALAVFAQPDLPDCGLALSENQSDQARSRRFLSRRGSARLRISYYQATLVAVKYDPHLRAYHHRRVSQDLLAKQSVLSVARKLVRISYAPLNSRQPYQTSRVAQLDPDHL